MRCPSCASETFTYISRWIPAPERRRTPRPATSSAAEMYRGLIAKEAAAPTGSGRRLLKQGVVGLTALGLVGWFFRKKS